MNYREIENVLNALNKREDLSDIYYEAWIDLEENWGAILDTYNDGATDEGIIDFTAEYLKKRDKWYDSPEYIEFLDNMVKDIENEDVDILTKIINWCVNQMSVPKDGSGEVFAYAMGYEKGMNDAKAKILEIINSEKE